MIAGIIGLGFFFALLGAGLWIGAALGIAGLASLFAFTDFPAGRIMALNVFNWNNSFVLAAIPMFIFMGELLFHTKISTTLYRGLSPLLSWLPGKLLHSNVLGCALFAAISGSSGATVATIGSVAVHELTDLGYDKKLTLGSLCGGGTLGLLIPPSLDMIVYCFLVKQSVGQLFVAGVFPGLLVAGLFSAYIAVIAMMHPEVAPSIAYSWKNRLRALLDLIPTGCLIFLVLGGIYMGWSTPTEAAAMGVGGAVVLGLINKTFTWKAVKEALIEAILISGLFMFVMTGACFYATGVVYIGFTDAMANLMLTAPVPPYVILIFIALLFIALGCITGGAGILVMTIPIIYPGAMALGYDPIWFGVFCVLLDETSQMTPPVGINLFILMSISGEGMGTIVRASLPFLVLLCVALVIITIFPDIALWLPNLMIRG